MKTHLLLEKALLVRLQLLILVGKAVERLTFLYLLSIWYMYNYYRYLFLYVHHYVYT